MLRSLEMGFDSHVSFNVFSGPVPKVCAPAGKRKDSGS